MSLAFIKRSVLPRKYQSRLLANAADHPLADTFIEDDDLRVGDKGRTLFRAVISVQCIGRLIHRLNLLVLFANKGRITNNVRRNQIGSGQRAGQPAVFKVGIGDSGGRKTCGTQRCGCLLYTSDAADE